MARHTFATTLCLSNGIAMETLSKMLEHSSIDTTQIYGKITDHKIQEDMTALAGRQQAEFEDYCTAIMRQAEPAHCLRSSSFRAKVQGRSVCPARSSPAEGGNFCTYENLSEYEQKNIFVRTEIYRLAEEKIFSSARKFRGVFG